MGRKQTTVEQIKSENKQMKDLLTQFSNWPDEMCNWLDAGVRARGVSTILLKKLSEELLPLKPLSELHKDEEACKDLLCFVFGYQNVDRSQLEIINHNFKTEIYDYSNKISIWHDGAFYKYGKGSSIVKIFQIVDFIRSIGYDVQPESKTP